ncbi:hydantoinase/oxoprolinase family protein [Actinophytocola sp.]|uniref:hydantoinase/oxoprolinase family protein n=1 Tax=Actinophytocola sp. TaxID=1872138 RepID=UPI003D6A0A99
MANLRLGCDVGGTFTDFILFDPDTGKAVAHKRLTTPDNPANAVLSGLGDLEARQPGTLAAVRHVIHGTTLAINAVIERSGPTTALVTTRGFRDVLEMRRHMRDDVYDIVGSHTPPLVPRDLRLEIRERMSKDGESLVPVDPAEVRQIAQRLRDLGVRSVAVVLLHAYAYPAHERQIYDILKQELPDVLVSISSEVHPEIKEFERTSTTVINAYTRPLIAAYLDELEDRLIETGCTGALLLTHSSGGLIAKSAAAAFPVRIMESGPVAGVLGASHIAREIGITDVLAFDMGGTTAKACVVIDGELPITAEYEVDRALRFREGSGLPVAVPTVDLIEVGAGGGSIAAINDRGLIGVGPASAGADPGPACYARGGERPTVTDADVALGYIDPGYFLGGEMRLDKAAAETAIGQHVGEPLGLDVERAAFGIHDVVNENMMAAAQGYLAERGMDASKLTMVAFGGAGPVHAYGVARKLGVPRVIVPNAAGLASALGFLIAPVSYSLVQSVRGDLDQLSPNDVVARFEEMTAEATAVLVQAEATAEFQFEYAADVCYAGQDASITIPIGSAPVFDPDELSKRFLEAYAAQYGHAYDDVPRGLLRLRLLGRAVTTELAATMPRPPQAGDAASARKGTRRAMDPVTREWAEFDVYDRYALPAGARVAGPAIVEENECTTLIGPYAELEVTQPGHLLITLKEVLP